METIVLKVLAWVLGLFGGAAVLENALENYIMDHVPQGLKGLVVPLVSLIFGFVLNLQQGMAPGAAIALALGLAGATTALHNNPATTSADVSLPDPPADAQGVPGVKG